jgi:hypothetical protein
MSQADVALVRDYRDRETFPFVVKSSLFGSIWLFASMPRSG